MEAIGDQLAEFGGSAGVPPRAVPRPGRRREAFDGGARPGLPARLHAATGAPTTPVPSARPGTAASALFRSASPLTATEFGPCNTDEPDSAVDLASIGAVLAGLASVAPESLASADYVEAAEFSGQVEEVSRTVEYLQILAAGAVDRTRTQAITDAATARAGAARSCRGWVTGWSPDRTEALTNPDARNNPDALNTTGPLKETDANWPATAATPDRPETTDMAIKPSAVVTSPTDDGCRNTAEFLRLRLHIPIREARRRLALAHQTLPGSTLTGEPLPPARPHLAAALTPTSNTSSGDDGTSDNGSCDNGSCDSAPAVSSYAATIITATLDRLQHHTSPETLDLIEHDLTATAATSDPDFLTQVARRWADTINADGTEPTEEALRHTQGAFIRKPRHGLHHIEIFATPEQYEPLATAMNAATNPRTSATKTDPTSKDARPDASNTAEQTSAAPLHGNDAETSGPDLDRRTRPQRQLDGILSALTAGLTTNLLPTTGGNRPQIIATINHRDLFATHKTTGTGDPVPNNSTGPRRRTEPPTSTSLTATGTLAFTGPVTAATLRKLACDADIIPVVLGSNGEILDVGRKNRLFTPAQRTALTARDQGCAFPNCTAPAPWCEAHHITYWSRGGNTSVENGVLLCSHHHHLIHKEQWTITTQHGIPMFIPPPHIDPTQKPQQNHYFKPPPPPRPRE